MAKFVYRMQNILNLKLKLEEQAKIAFSTANAKLREEAQQRVDKYLLKANREPRFKEITKRCSEGRLVILEMRRCSEAIEIKKMQAEDQKKQIRLAERNVEIARKKLNDVMIERKTQEILRDKAFEEFKQELKEEEKKETDELTSYQYNGNGKE